MNSLQLWNGGGGAGSQGPQGDPGADGADGRGYAGSSNSSMTLGTGMKSFDIVLATPSAYQDGGRIRVSRNGNEETHFMEGVIISITGDTINFSSDYFVGTGTYSSWDVNVAGERGAEGAAGAAGRDAGLKYTYSSTTTASDPGSGTLRFNNATLASATALYISETDGDANGIAAQLATWDDSTATIKGTLTVVKDGAPGNLAVFSITGTLTDNGTWDTFTVANVVSTGTISNNDVVKLFFARTGNDGATGAAGSSTGLMGYRFGMTWKRNGTSNVQVSIGICRDSTNTEDMELTSAISKTTSSWAVGTGNGGLDTGTITDDTFYYIHVIKRTDTNVVDVLFSLSRTAPTLPANYTKFRVIGAIKTTTSDVSNVVARYIGSDIFVHYATLPALDVSGTGIDDQANQYSLPSIPNITGGLKGEVAIAADMNIVLDHASVQLLLTIGTPSGGAVPSATASPLAGARMLTTTGEVLHRMNRVPLLSGNVLEARSSGTSTTFRVQILGYYWPANV